MVPTLKTEDAWTPELNGLCDVACCFLPNAATSCTIGGVVNNLEQLGKKIPPRSKKSSILDPGLEPG